MFGQDKTRITGKPVIETKIMRNVHADTLMGLAGQDGRIVILDMDLMNPIETVPFARAYPERSFNCGIQEADMIGTAAGMSAVGSVPFTHTFGCFIPRRVTDQVLTSCTYVGLSVKMISGGPGITAAYNDDTHTALEDCAIMCSIPGIVIMEPADDAVLADMLRQTTNTPDSFYIQLLRKQAVKVHEGGSVFSFGEATTLRGGSDVNIFASGICMADVLTAANMLAPQGIRAEIVNLLTIKSIDTEGVTASVKKAGVTATVENHNIIDGLDSAVSGILTEYCPAPLERLGVHNTFGKMGLIDYLEKQLQMMPEDIVKAALRAINHRQNV